MVCFARKTYLYEFQVFLSCGAGWSVRLHPILLKPSRNTTAFGLNQVWAPQPTFKDCPSPSVCFSLLPLMGAPWGQHVCCGPRTGHLSPCPALAHAHASPSTWHPTPSSSSTLPNVPHLKWICKLLLIPEDPSRVASGIFVFILLFLLFKIFLICLVIQVIVRTFPSTSLPGRT